MVSDDSFIESSFSRIVSWVDFIQKDPNPEPDKARMANDIQKFIRVANEAHDVIEKKNSKDLTPEEAELKVAIDILWVP